MTIRQQRSVPGSCAVIAYNECLMLVLFKHAKL